MKNLVLNWLRYHVNEIVPSLLHVSKGITSQILPEVFFPSSVAHRPVRGNRKLRLSKLGQFIIEENGSEGYTVRTDNTAVHAITVERQGNWSGKVISFKCVGEGTRSFTVPLSIYGNDATHATVLEQVIDDVLCCFPKRLVEVLHAMCYRRGSILADVILADEKWKIRTSFGDMERCSPYIAVASSRDPNTGLGRLPRQAVPGPLEEPPLALPFFRPEPTAHDGGITHASDQLVRPPTCGGHSSNTPSNVQRHSADGARRHQIDRVELEALQRPHVRRLRVYLCLGRGIQNVRWLDRFDG